MLVCAALLAALGIWQLERREWKHALIAAVEARIHAAPVAAPGPEAWGAITAENDAYRRVTAIGHFRNDSVTLVKAVTERGSGYWVMTPLETRDFTLLINRGFIPDAMRARVPAGPDQAQVTGLLRVTEPKGGFLRSNDPQGNRWYSRDVAAIAGSHGLSNVAPYFIDADATPNPGGYPVGGLTVVNFPDSHMVYALTWFGLAAMALWAAWFVTRRREATA
ncbi:SURF1 family protein [Sphingomonas sp. R-74633]|nr:SURF1 family protein [Sphingomonas sp. R-74633]NYT42212.1 SURF1 family protein [Sphingomonas sp. R-74633]